MDKKVFMSRHGRKVIKESLTEATGSKEERIAKAIALLKEIPSDDFYPALLIYERLGEEHPSEKLIGIVSDIADEFESVYDESLRYSIEEAVEGMPEEEMKAKISVSVEPEKPEVKEESVEEKLGEFRKGGSLGSRKPINKDFDYSK